jgi:hypothetical protein
MTTTTAIPGWTTLAQDPAVLIKEYGFGAGRANAMAVRLPDRSFMIMSPPIDASDAEKQAFLLAGGVSALVECNGAHHLGLGAWRAKFPSAVTYAAPRAAARIRKKGKDPGELEPVEKLQARAGDKVSLVQIAGDKIGDVCMRVRTDKGILFYAGDFFANVATLPSNLIFKLVFKLTNSGPGLKVFGVFFKFFVADKRAARDSLIAELEANPPKILVPAHGDVVSRQDLGPTLVSMLREAI